MLRYITSIYDTKQRVMKSALKIIFFSGILAGMLDCFSAVVFLGNMNFAGVWKYVASGYFGNAAFAGGNAMVVYGLLFHFSIAFFWAMVYYFLVSKIHFFTNNPVLGGLLYGVVIWLVMTFLVLPMANIPRRSFSLIGAIKNVTILMICVGLPVSLITNKLKLRQVET